MEEKVFPVVSPEGQTPALGNKVTRFQGFDTFPKPKNCDYVEMVSDEVTANCPVTGQPDFYTITIKYPPQTKCLESKSLKLYFQSMREKGEFCEAMAGRIAEELSGALDCPVEVQVVQKSRGGISIHSVGRYHPGMRLKEIMETCTGAEGEKCIVCLAAAYCADAVLPQTEPIEETDTPKEEPAGEGSPDNA